MAQTKKKRKRKHRGTPAGTIERSARAARPQNREDAKLAARQRRAERMDREPTWRGSVNRAAFAAALFGVLVVVLFKKDLTQGVSLALLMFLFYIPLGYATDSAVYKFRQRKRG